jgi:hypothetical protein
VSRLLPARAWRAWLTRRPLLNALWLETTNQPLRLWLVTLATAAGAALALGFAARGALPSLLRALASHAITVDILVALQASVLVHLGRRKWTLVYSSNWLSTLPLPRRSVTRMVALRSLLRLTPVLGLMAVVPVSLLGGVGLAAVAGALLGWYLPRRESHEMHAVPLAASESQPSTAATVRPLGHWTSTQAKAWLQPRLLSRLLLPAMLALPMDTSANVAIALLAVWVLAVYLVVLLAATVHVARSAAQWLLPTPLTFYRLAWAVARRPVLKQLQWTAAAAILLVALGCEPTLAARVAEMWLAWVTLAVGVTLACGREPGNLRLRVRLIVSACAVALLERLRQHLALPGALLISACYLRRGARP